MGLPYLKHLKINLNFLKLNDKNKHFFDYLLATIKIVEITAVDFQFVKIVGGIIMGFRDIDSILSFPATTLVVLLVLGIIFLFLKKRKIKFTTAVIGAVITVDEAVRKPYNRKNVPVTRVDDALLEKMGFYFTHPLTQEIHPHYKTMTFEQFLKREVRRLSKSS